jgi:hypothetical protein
MCEEDAQMTDLSRDYYFKRILLRKGAHKAKWADLTSLILARSESVVNSICATS